MAQGILIQVKNLGKTYYGLNPVAVLAGLDFSLTDGEFVAIIGASGSGKTTLIRILGGLEAPTAGQINYKRALKFGFVFQEANLLARRTVYSNVALPLIISGLTASQIKKRVGAVLRLVGLERYQNFFPKDLSGGMKQRVAIARALVVDPAVLIMDEPFSALDVITREVLMAEVKKIWRRTKKTIVYVTYNLDEALALSERVLVIGGKPATIKRVVKVAAAPEAVKLNDERTKFKRELKSFLREKKTVEPAERFETEPIYKKILYGLLSVLVFLVFIFLWRSLVMIFKVPDYLVPLPEKVYVSFVGLAENGVLWRHALISINEIILGLLAGTVVGVLLGFVFGKLRSLERIFWPYIVALQSAPKIILAPLIVVWFGFGIGSKVLLISLIVFFPILVNVD